MSPDEITTWLVRRLSALLEVPAEEIAEARTVGELGLDSLHVARITEELRELTGAALPPTLFYDLPDLPSIAQRIAAGMAPEDEPRRARVAIAIAASFTIEPIEEALDWLLEQAGLPAALAFAPYSQVFQQLLDPQQGFARGRAAAHAVLLRIEDLFRHSPAGVTVEGAQRVGRELADALAQARARVAGPLTVMLCPHDPAAAPGLAAADVLLREAIASVAGVGLLDLADAPQAHADPVRDRLGHIPYTPAGYAALALALGRCLHRDLRPPAKVIAVDCDYTLWHGAVGEEGAGSVAIQPGHRDLQAFLLGCQRGGRLLALASKNREDEAWAVFDTREDMVLRREHIAAARIDWEPKPQNLRAIADELELGLDTFVFVDDSPAECAAVRAACPQVTVVQLPPDPAQFGPFVRAHWAFDAPPATAEDRRRTEMYRQGRERRNLQTRAASFEDYLATLELRIDIRPLAAAELARAAQLTQRTNQFNTTTLRRSETELRRLMDARPAGVLTMHVQDRFGDYGLIGLATLRWGDGICEVDNLLMSCRVLGRRVEHALVRHIAALAVGAGCTQVRIPFVATARNQPVQRFLQGLGGGLRPAGQAQVVAFAPADVESVLATAQDVRLDGPVAASASPEAGDAAASEGLAAIAALRDDPHALVHLLAGRIAPRPDVGSAYLAPRTPLQIELARVWRDVLRLDRVGVNDDFYALGGDSLSGAELVARSQRLGLPENMALGILGQHTVAGMAQAIEDARAGRQTRLVPELASLESQARLPADVDALARQAAGWQAPGPARTYFLTGATGYVGAYLAAQLLAQPDVRLVCHARARDAADAMRRVRGNLERYRLWQPAFDGRVDVVAGDLAVPRLGLADADYEGLARSVDAVIHNGATVNFVLPYSNLRAANVDGTLEALRFAAHGRTKPLHFVSTLGVLMSGYAHEQVVAEDQELDHSEDLPNGYEQTKWVADKMVWHAMRAGYPAAIYRLGMLSGLAACGTYHKLSEFLPSFLKGCVQLGSFPRLDTKVEMVPVDMVTGALAGIVGRPDALGKVFHMNHPSALTDEDFVRFLRFYGYPVRFLPWDVWKRELTGSPQLRGNALYPFLDFVRGLQAHQTRIPDMDMANFLGFAGARARACPDQWTLLQRYFDHFVEVGYLEPPAARGAARAAG